MLILCMPEGQGHWLWTVLDHKENHSDWHTAPSLDELIQHVPIHYQGKQAMVYFPSTMAQYVSQALPRSQFKKLGLHGIQYLIEEQVIEPIESLAIFSQYDHEQIHFMALPKSTQEMLQHSLNLLPWTIQALLPDFLLVPEPNEHEVNLLQLEERLLLRWSNYQGWVLEDLTLLTELPCTIHRVNAYQLNESQLSQVKVQLGADIDYINEPHHQSTIPLRHPFNALVKRQGTQRINGYWQACAFMLCAAVLSQASYDGIRWWQYQKQANVTAQLALDQYKSWFPEEHRINEKNLKSQFQAKVQQNANVDREALQLISRVAPILQQASISAAAVSYQNHALNLSLLAQSSDKFNPLVEQFKQQGFNVQLGEIRNQGNQVLGLLKVE